MIPALARGIATLTGYAIAWGLALGLAFMACNAATADRGGPTYVPPPAYQLFDTPAPTKATPRPKATKAPKIAPASPIAADPATDCGGVDPADPEIDPAIDCADVAP